MQVSIEEKDTLTRVLNITVEAGKFDELFNEHLLKVAKDMKMDGFRPGKVPLSVVQQRLGASIGQEVASELMMQTFPVAAMEHNIVPAGMPSFKVNKLVTGQDFEYSATVEIFPDIQLQPLQKESAERIESTIAPEDVQMVVKRIQEQRAEYEVVERPAQKNDEVILDFDGSIDGDPLDQGSAKDFKLHLGSNTMIPGFEEGIMGKKAGDSFDMKLQFPTEYHHKAIAGKEVLFKITIHSVAGQKLPELNEAFFAEFDLEAKNLEAFLARIEKDMQRDLTQRLKSLNKKSLFNALLNANPLVVPKPLVEQEIDNMIEEAKRPLSHLKEANKFNIPRDIFREEAQRRVQLGLLVQEVIKTQELKVDEDTLQKEINTMAEAYEDADEYRRWINQNDKVRQNFEALLLEDMAAEWLATQMTVVPVQKNYDAIINPEDASTEQ